MRARNRWHESHRPATITTTPQRTVDAIAARNRAVVALRESLPHAAATRRLMTAAGEFKAQGGDHVRD